MIRFEECDYDLRGCTQSERCPECGVEFDQDLLRADQNRSDRGITFGLKLIAVAVSVYMVNALLWIISEDLLRVAPTPLMLGTVLIGIPGGAALLLAFRLALLRLQHGNRLRRPHSDPRQARLIPDETRFWISFNAIGIALGMAVCSGNPLWHWVLRCFR